MTTERIVRTCLNHPILAGIFVDEWLVVSVLTMELGVKPL